MKFNLHSVLSAWNQVGLDLVKGAERGPTTSSRFYALLNMAMREALEYIESKPSNDSLTNIFASAQQSAAFAAHKIITTIGIDLLNDQYLENKWDLSEGTGIAPDNPPKFGDDVSASDQKKYFLSIADNLLQQIISDTGLNSGYSEKIGHAAAHKVIDFSYEDGADQNGDYQGESSYQIQHWIEDRDLGPLIERPTSSDGTPLTNKQINYNFYDEDRWIYKNFNPNIALASLPEGFVISEKGVLSTSNDPGFMEINPAVKAGQTSLTSTWQSITDWGIFPTIDDGGTQKPLTPHWGDVDVYSFDSADDYQLTSYELPYLPDGSLNQAFVDEARQLAILSKGLQTGQSDAAHNRAIAEYWELGDGSPYPSGHWIDLTNDILLDSKITISDDIASDLLFAVSQSVRDAGAIGWGLKYNLDTVRPFTAINQLFYGSITPDWEGDDLAQIDDREGWNPYQLRRNYTPPFPDIVSGHSAFSTSSSVVLRGILGSNYYPYQSVEFNSRFSGNDGFDGISSNGNEARSLQWNYFSQQAEEAGFSRMLGGIHMASGNVEGMKLGIEIGHRVLQRLKLDQEGLKLEGDVSETLSTMIPDLIFGTLANDSITGTFSSTAKVGEVYAFGGDDLISYNVSDNSSLDQIHLFGGLGNDRFLLDAEAVSINVRIADFEAGDTIEVINLGSSDSVDDFKFNIIQTDAGTPITQIMLDNNLLFELDGYFERNLLEAISIS